MTTQTLSEMSNDTAGVQTPTKPKPTSAEAMIAADVARREAERLERRRAIRADISRRAELLRELEAVDGQLRELDRRADSAAADHAAATEPLQRGLQTASGDKRAKLLSQLTDVNLALEDKLHAIGRVRQPLQRRRRDLMNEVALCKTEQFLSGADVASPALSADKFAAEHRLRHAEARVREARDKLAFLEPQLREASTTKVRPSDYGHVAIGKPLAIDLETVSHLSRRVREWTCELLCAEQELHQAAQDLRFCSLHVDREGMERGSTSTSAEITK